MSCRYQMQNVLFRNAIQIAKGKFDGSVKEVAEKAITRQFRKRSKLDPVEPIWLFAYLDDYSGRQTLESYLKSNQPQERIAAAIGVVLSHELSGVTRVATLLCDKDENVRKAVAALLGWHGGDYVVELVKSIKGIDSDTLHIFASIINSKYANNVLRDQL